MVEPAAIASRGPFRLIPQGRLRSLMMAVIFVAFVVFIGTWVSGLKNNGDEEATLNYIRLYGSTSESYEPSQRYFVLSRVLGKNARFFCSRRLTINMEPRDFTDNTIDELVAVHNLDRIVLFAKNTQSGTKLAIVPLGQAETSATPRGIAKFQRLFPNVTIHAVQKTAETP